MMKNKFNVKVLCIVFILSLILIILAYVSLKFRIPSKLLRLFSNGIEPTSTTASEQVDEKFQKLLQSTQEKISDQTLIDQNLKSEMDSGQYTFDAPLVVVDPYNESPLTALVLFKTKEPTNISIHIPGTNDLSNVDFSFSGFNTEHFIPVYGLYAKKENNITLLAKTEDGIQTTTNVKISTESLDPALKNIIRVVSLENPSKYAPGFNFTYSNNYLISKTAFDVNGDIRWYLSTTYLNSQLTYDGHYVFSIGDQEDGEVIFLEMNPLGRIFRVMYASNGNHHDMAIYKDQILVTGSKGSTVEDFIYALDPATGVGVRSFDLRTILPRSRYTGFVTPDDPDWFHNNAIVWVEGTDDILISSRVQSAVIRMSWPDGKIKWILGNHIDWLPMYQKYLLTPIGENFQWQYNQHDPVIMPDQDNDPNTMDILIFDNGNQRYSLDAEIQRQIDAHEIPVPELYSRLVQFRIDETKMTITQIRQFGQEYGLALFSPARGSVELLPNGNLLGCFDTQSDATIVEGDGVNIVEIDPNGKLVWEALEVTKDGVEKMYEYRVERHEIYQDSDNDLQIGAPVIDLIPESIYEKYSNSK